jgi:hypothetical protein
MASIAVASWEDLAGITAGDDYHLTRSLLKADADYATYNGGVGWLPPTLNGVFDGAGFYIEGLQSSRSQGVLGLFAYAQGTIKDLTVVNASITPPGWRQQLAVLVANMNGALTIQRVNLSGGVSGTGYAGLLIGVASVNATLTIEDVTAHGGVSCIGNFVGGLIGHLHAKGTITRTLVDATVFCGRAYAGGFVGNVRNTDTVVISKCAVRGTLTLGNALNTYAGGFVGFLREGSVVEDCYSRMDVSGGRRIVAGFCGYNEGSTIRRSYSCGAVQVTGDTNRGGFCALSGSSPTYTGNVFDKDVAGYATSPAGEGAGVAAKTTAQMKTLATYTGVSWDMVLAGDWVDEDWYVDADVDYPYLGLEHFAVPAGEDTILTKYFSDAVGTAAQAKWIWCYIPPWTKVKVQGFQIKTPGSWEDVTPGTEPPAEVAGVMSGLSGDNAILNGNWVKTGTDSHYSAELDGNIVTNKYAHATLPTSLLACSDVMVSLEEGLEEVVFTWECTGEEGDPPVAGFTSCLPIWSDGPFTLEAINALTSEFNSEWDDNGVFAPPA